jgi:hypothetical protein
VLKYLSKREAGWYWKAHSDGRACASANRKARFVMGLVPMFGRIGTGAGVGAAGLMEDVLVIDSEMLLEEFRS